MITQEDLVGSFTDFFRETEPRLRFALVAALGRDDGLEAVSEAFAYGWAHWEDLREMENPAGYLYRVGITRGRRLRRRPVDLPKVDQHWEHWVEPGLPLALGRLSERQRVSVVLVHCLGWRATEVASLLQVSLGTVQKHLQRGMNRLRQQLGVEL